MLSNLSSLAPSLLAFSLVASVVAAAPVEFNPNAPKYSCEDAYSSPASPLRLSGVDTSVGKTTILLSPIGDIGASLGSEDGAGDATTGRMCVLSRWTTSLIDKEEGNGFYFPLGRSVAGVPGENTGKDGDWNRPPGKASWQLRYTCGEAAFNGTNFVEGEYLCEVTLPMTSKPDIKDPATIYAIRVPYYLTYYERTLSVRNELSRFLHLTTFGPKAEELDALEMAYEVILDDGYLNALSNGTSSGNATSVNATSVNATYSHSKAMSKLQVEWVAAQQDPTTFSSGKFSSHREYWRKRLNPRKWETYRIGEAGPAPCELHSRWRKFAFTEYDVQNSRALRWGTQDLGGAFQIQEGHKVTIEKVVLESMPSGQPSLSIAPSVSFAPSPLPTIPAPTGTPMAALTDSPTVSFAPTGSNIMGFGDMEDATDSQILNSWTSQAPRAVIRLNPNITDPSLDPNTPKVHSGSASLEFVGGRGFVFRQIGSGCPEARLSEPINAGDVIRISLWVRMKAANKVFTVYTGHYHTSKSNVWALANDNSYIVSRTRIAAANVWTKIESIFVVGDDWTYDGVLLPPEKCNHYQLRFRAERTTAGFYIDDLIVDKIARGSPKALRQRDIKHGFLKNPDFVMNYQYYLPLAASGDIVKDDDSNSKNVFSLKRGQMLMQNIQDRAIPAERYQFTFWAKLSGTPSVETRAIVRMRFVNNDLINGPCRRAVCNLFARPLIKVIRSEGRQWQRILSDEFSMFGNYNEWDGTVSFIRFTIFTRNMASTGELRLSNFEFVGNHSITGEVFTDSPTISHQPTPAPSDLTVDNIAYVVRYGGDIRTVIKYPLQVDNTGELLITDGSRKYELCQVDEVEGRWGVFPNRMNFVVGGKCVAIRGGNPTVHIDPWFVNVTDLHILDVSKTATVTPINVEQTYGGDLLLESTVEGDVCATFPSPYDNDYRGADPVNPEDKPSRFNPDKAVFALLPDGSYALYDSRLVTTENSLDYPALDGGGKSVLRSTIRAQRDGFEASVLSDGREQYYVFNDQNIALCMNEQPNFINRDHCVLSFDENACVKKGSSFVDVQLVITFDEDTLAAMHSATLASYREADPVAGITARDNSRYIYAVTNLRFDDSITDGTAEGTLIDLPCYRHHGNPTSRWIPRPDLDAANCTNSLHEETVAVLRHTLETSNDENPYIRDIVLWNQIEGDACNEADLFEHGMLIMTSEGCWENVHPDYMSLFDFTDYVAAHPMPTTPDTSITGFSNVGMLEYPDFHPMSYFEDLKTEEGVLIRSLARYVYATTSRVNQNARYGDKMVVDQFSQMIGISNDRLNLLAVADNLGTIMLSNQIEYNRGGGTLVCGSPNEVKADPTLDDYFDTQEADLDCIGCQNSYGNYYAQKQSVWLMNVLEGEDQLCQRMSWALYEHLNVGITTAPDNTETNLYSYDIMTRNCFGSYFDILKEMTYNPKIGEQFNSVGSQASRQPWDASGLLVHPDENLGREIMQLFTVGLKELNPDGSTRVDKFGRSSQTYNNRDIMANARILTGFVYTSRRGNVEELFRSQKSRMEPMRLEIDSHDFYPKTSIDGGWIGDRYPLCVDLPRHHFLRKGATFRFRGGSSLPQSHFAPGHWDSDESIRRFVLSPESSLYQKLCNPDGSGKCQFTNNVSLDSNLPCHHRECRVDDVIMIQVTPGAFYEYIRQPCVQLSFYDNAKKVVTGFSPIVSELGRRHTHGMCANPLIASASRSCCDIEVTNVAEYNYKMEYHGERTLFASNSVQCLADGGRVCDSDALIADNPLVNIRTTYDKIYPSENTMFWTDASCTLSLKVRADGMVAIIHKPLANPFFGDRTVPYVDINNTVTYINVPWERHNMTFEEIFPSVADNECGGGACVATSDNMCHCQVTLSETPVFDKMPARENVLSLLMIGAFDPTAFADDNNATSATYSLLESSEGVDAYVVSESSIGATSTIFKVTDEFGKTIHLKNMASTITLGGLYTLRNFPSFIDLAAPELRDAEFEIDAFLMNLIQYPSSPPFISKKLLQLHGFSNPSPGQVQRVAEAFMQGTYTKEGRTFGDGRYGSLAAVSAAIALDPESLSHVLDEDPIQGNIREPLLKVVGVMRSMDFQRRTSVKFRHGLLDNMRFKIGQMVYEPPDQFSFFSNDYEPPGPFAASGIVAPEAELLAMSNVVGLTNGLWSLYNYGLTHLFGGFGPYLSTIVEVGDYSSSVGHLHYLPTASDVSTKIDELSTLLTAGRLSAENKQVLFDAYNRFHAMNGTQTADRILMKLISSAPEFHTSNTVRKTGTSRPVSPPPEMSSTPYKAIVYVNLFGGLDSFNVLTPHNGGGCYLYGDYFAARGGRKGIGLTMDQILPIHGSSAGITGCNTFGVNYLLTAFKEIYDEGKGIFLANIGHLHKPVTKANWQTETRTDLFSHHTMKKESHEVDAFKEGEGPGVLGRMLDVLERNGEAVGATAVNSRSVMIDGSPKTGRLADVLNTESIARIYEPNWLNDKSQDFREYLELLNSKTSENSGMFADKWSQTFVDVWNKTDALVSSIRGVKPVSSFSTHLDANSIGSQLKLIARLIQIRNERGSGINRDVFHAQMSGYDAHFKVAENLGGRLPSLNLAVANFWQEMKAQGVEDQVTVIIGSEFGRTITPNANDGSDHGWAGNSFMFGGAVRGGRILGEYPRTFGEDTNPMNVGRGRLIPSRPWDALYYGLAQWFGITDTDDLNYVLPNNGNFGCLLYTDSDLFTTGTHSLKGCGGPEYTSPVTLQVPEPRNLIGEEQKALCKLAVISMGEKLGFEPNNSRCYIADQVVTPSEVAPGSYDVKGVAMLTFDGSVPPGKVSQEKVNNVMVIAATIAADFVVREALPQSAAPSSMPSAYPTVSSMPSFLPSVSSMPSSEPSEYPSAIPTVSAMPSGEPSISNMPTSSGPTTTSSPTSSPSISTMPTVSTYPTPAPTARAVFEEDFTFRDIGSVEIAGGSSSPESGLRIIQGSGEIWSTADDFYYAFIETSGDMTFTALIEGFSAADPWAKAGIMVRKALSRQSSHYSMFLTRGQGVVNMYRTCSSNCTTSLARNWLYTPSSVWLKVTKVGNVMTAYYRPTSSTQNTWYQFGVSLSIVDIASSGYYVGIAVASNTNTSVATVDVSNIQLSRVCSAASITTLQCEQASNCEWGAMSSTCYNKGTKPSWEDGYDYEGSYVASVLDSGSTVVGDNCADMVNAAAVVDGTTTQYACDRSSFLSETPGVIVSPSHGQLSLVNGIRVYTGYDANADPTSFQLQGRTLPGSLVRDKWDNLCWEVKPDDGMKVVPSACDASNPLQLFYKTPWGTIRVKGLPGKCLDDPEPEKDLYFYDCHLEANQRWLYDAASQRVSNVMRGNCIDYNHNTGYLWSHSCHEGSNQKFYWQEETWNAVSGTGANILERHSNIYCMEAVPTSGSELIKSAPCNNLSPSQKFYLTPDGLIKRVGADLCLDMPTDGKSEVYLGSCHGGKNQRWIYDSETETLTSAHDGSCLDFNYDSTYLTHHACHEGNNQKWSFGSDSFFPPYKSWQDIAAGQLSEVSAYDRNGEGSTIWSTNAMGDGSKFFMEASFFNNTSIYSEYKVLFPTQRAANYQYLQMAEIELTGLIVDLPHEEIKSVEGSGIDFFDTTSGFEGYCRDASQHSYDEIRPAYPGKILSVVACANWCHKFASYPVTSGGLVGFSFSSSQQLCWCAFEAGTIPTNLQNDPPVDFQITPGLAEGPPVYHPGIVEAFSFEKNANFQCYKRDKTKVGVYMQPNLSGASGGGCGTESENLVSIVKNFIQTDGTFSSFVVDESVTTFGDTNLASKLASMKFFLMVDIEGTLAGWDATSQGILKSFVQNGGTMVMTGTYGTNDVNFLNDAFGWDLSDSPCVEVPISGVNTVGTPWEGTSPTLACPSATQHVSCNSVPCTPIWGTETSAAVVVLPYGTGRVIYLGFDFYDAGYEVNGWHVNCASRENPWVTSALRGSLLYAKAISPAPADGTAVAL